MRKTSTVILLAALLAGNGYLLISWLCGTSETNDVGRQWFRIIIPGMMIIFSVGTIVIIWIVDRLVRSRKKTGIE